MNKELQYIDTDNIKEKLLYCQKLEKAWAIVKKKNVNFECLKIILANLPRLSSEEHLKRYNGGLKKKYQLNQDEFELLKEVLEK